MKKILLFPALFAISFAYTQKEANFWYFGSNCGVSFENGEPKALINGALSTEEGCSVISDKNGRLLFYTDGISVWNSSHKVMPNGKELMGHPSSTQSSVAIPLPKNPTKYVLFTVADVAKPAGLQYSMVDISLDGGMGDVISAQKNVLLKTPVTEKLTAVTHRNGTDIWVIAHGWENDEFYAYLVTETGVATSPIVSKIGSVHKSVKAGSTLNTQGYLKSNPDGTNLALALEEEDAFEVFDFDSKTGAVSQGIRLTIPPKSYPYGIEFSPDGSMLYGTAAGTGEIYQFNMQAGSTEAIQASGQIVGKSPNKEWIGALQLANNGKIYFGYYKKDLMGCIEKPNELGTACGFKVEALKLEGKVAMLGLPTFTQSFFTQDLTDNNVKVFNEKLVKTGERFVLKNIQFEFAKYILKSTSFVELNKLVTVLKSNPTYTIQLLGHTDNIGNKSANILLSENRANEVKKYLIQKGIAESRITTRGYGSSKPIANNESDAGRAKNRRVEFILGK